MLESPARRAEEAEVGRAAPPARQYAWSDALRSDRLRREGTRSPSWTTSNMGDRSCLATDGKVAAVAGPQRDIGRVLTLVDAEGSR